MKPDIAERKSVKLETSEYSAGPLYNRYMGKCLQVVFTVDESAVAENALTHRDVLMLVKTVVDPIEAPSDNGVLFEGKHFNFQSDVPLRISSACLHGSLGDTDCLCHQETIAYMEQIREHGYGVFVYLPQDAQGRGLRNKVRDHRLIHGVDNQGQKIESVSAEESFRILYPEGYDIRRYMVLKEIFSKLGLADIRFRYLGEGEDKRRQIVDEARLLIGSVLKEL
ncbi:hypothetical protein HYV56_00215 [Candidatus Peregrinibacteria bacterium]|nr:hypothetical protein [Candidatus Peregrinibacteria bacterium]